MAAIEISNRRAGCIIAIVTFAVFANSLSNAFVNFDDPALVTENPAIKSLAPSNLIAIFTPEPGATYQPLRVLSYAIDWAIWGDSPFGYHLMNTLLHGLAAWLLFLFVCELLPAIGKPAATDRMVALGAALLFLVHPINVEAVVWISSRKYGLLAVFYLLTVWLHLRGRFGAAVASAIATALSSPFAFSLPFVIILIDLCRNCKLRESLGRYAVYGLVCLAVLPLFLGGTGGELDVVKAHRGGFSARFLSLWRILFDSLANALLPFQLNNRYLDRASTGMELKIVLAMMASAGLAWLSWIRWKAGDRRLLLALGSFWLCWLPVSNLVSISTMMADRYLYLPAIALWVVLALWLVRSPRVGIALLVLLAVLTMQRNHVWRDSVALWTDSLQQEPNNHLAQCSLGLAHYANADFQDALPFLQRAYELDASYDQTRLYLGHNLDKLGQSAAAEAHYRWVLERKPDSVDVLVNLAIIRAKDRDIDSCEALLRRALKVDATTANAWSNLGNVLRVKQDGAGAAAAYREAVRLQPDFAEAHHALGTLLVQMGDFAGAIQSLERTLALNPSYPETHRWLEIARQGLRSQ